MSRRASHPSLVRETTNALGSYLRARRERVSPEQVGIASGGVRRVPGLRREEVAILAGISADYYLRLERGRDRKPSMQVLDALARVLQLDDQHVAHLRTLAAESVRARGGRPQTETAPPGVRGLVDALVQPAFVEGRYFDILASNAAARALNPRLRPGGNQLRDLFVDPAERALHRDWDAATTCLAASLRQVVGNNIDDPGYLDLVEELTRVSSRFHELWARHDVSAQRGAPIRIMHPDLGELTLHRERLSISGTDGLMLVIYHADAGSIDADKLAALADTRPADGQSGQPLRVAADSERSADRS